jgi:uncharacterized membrane protein
LHPFDIRSALLAKHAQHVVLIHFPIALFLTSVMFDFIAHWTSNRTMAAVAYYNLLVAAISCLPVMATGLLAWQLQLEGQKIKGVLLDHLVLATISSTLIWIVWWLHFRARRRPAGNLPLYRLPIELVAAGTIALTGHLGGFLSGVNGTG